MVKKMIYWIRSDSTRELVFLLLVVVLVRTFGFGLYQVPTGSMETTMLVGERFFADKLTPLFWGPCRGCIISFNDPMYEYSKNSLKRLFEEYFWGPSNWTKRVIGLPGDKIRGVIENGHPVIYVNDVKLDESYINKYPLIDLLNDDVKVVIEKAKKEALDFVAASHLDSQQFNHVFDQVLTKYHMRVSYDDKVSFDKQPFYSMLENQVLRNQDGSPMLTQAGLPLGSTGYEMKRHGNSYWNGTDEYYIELDDHHYWVLGDNRLGSHDCRFWGPLDGRYIHGKILFRIWSVDSREWLWVWDLIKHPIDFWTRVRWSRFFQIMH